MRTIFLLCVIWIGSAFVPPAWGFYGHRKVNRMAVFSLPQEMIGFYKKNIEFITIHSVDPDKRRYATKHEAVRHYIDIDHWGEFPFDNVPKNYSSAILKFSKILLVDTQGDSLDFDMRQWDELIDEKLDKEIRTTIAYSPDENPWSFDLSDGKSIYIKDSFSKYGILPYWLSQYQRRLVQAFANKDEKRILRISAEMGHYIGDAHVPLHTTENYNGQMSDQVGIHAFWESRIPELFADENYDFFVGKAEYIDDVDQYFWDVIFESHLLLEDVLGIEKELTQSYPSDKQWCYDDRLSFTMRIQCPEFAKAYAEKMDGMVELRMRDAILSLASIWYTAWVDAGQPDLDFFDKVVLNQEELKAQEKLELQFNEGDIKGREHDNGNQE